MNSSGDSAEQVVRLSLEGLEVVAKISGSATKNIVAMLYAISKDKSQPKKGKTRLANMLKTNKELKIFTVKQKDLQKFKEEAKRYGVLYCALVSRKDKKNKDPEGCVDIMVKADDAPKINRIVEKLELVTTANATVESVVEQSKDKPQTKDILEQSKPITDDMIDDIMGKPQEKEVLPSSGNAEQLKDNQLESSSMNKKDPIITPINGGEMPDKVLSYKEIKELATSSEKKSVRQEIQEIKKEMKKEEIDKEKSNKNVNKQKSVAKHMKQPKHSQIKSKNKGGRRYK